MPDRRGDGATATNSNAGMQGRGCDESCVAADPEHVAAAAALLERFKAKTKSQPFELQVRDAHTHACTHTLTCQSNVAVSMWELFCLLVVIVVLMTPGKKAAHSAEIPLCFTREASRLSLSQLTITICSRFARALQLNFVVFSMPVGSCPSGSTQAFCHSHMKLISEALQSTPVVVIIPRKERKR